MDEHPPPVGTRHRVVAPVRVDRDGTGGTGGLTRRRAAGPGWRRSSTGLYVPSATPSSVLQRIVEVGASLPPRAAVTGWAALAWRGGRWSAGLESDGQTERPVPVAMGRHLVRPRPGIALCEERFDPREVEVVDGIAVTTAVRSVCFEMRYAGSFEFAVVALDMAAYDDLVSIEEVDTWVQAHPSWTGIGQARRAVGLGEENLWSPMEVLTRLCWVGEAGLPVPRANAPLFDRSGRFLCTPDLLDPGAGVVGEYNGVVHAGLGARRRDRDRAEIYRDHGLECVTLLQGDLRDPGAVARRLHAAYALARQRIAPRTWTVEQPSWWTDTSTVERRRALTGVDRDIWLRYRR